MESCVNVAQLEEGKQMQIWYAWYNSNDPAAVERRQRDLEIEQKREHEKFLAEKEFLDFKELNPNLVKHAEEVINTKLKREFDMKYPLMLEQFLQTMFGISKRHGFVRINSENVKVLTKKGKDIE